MRASRSLLLSALCAGLSLATAASRASAVTTPPNFVLVMADDQGWGDMAYNGYPGLKTPNFDALAREGLRFDYFHAAAPVRSPTRGSVLTGRTPNRFGCFSWGYPLRPQEVTIAEALQQAESLPIPPGSLPTRTRSKRWFHSISSRAMRLGWIIPGSCTASRTRRIAP
jgi:hypothetical protein